MTKYVLGFHFDAAMKSVALIRKQKPEWQKGKLNGIGGKIEAGETPKQAMRREFNEEAGVLTNDWTLIGEMRGEDWIVYIHYRRETNVHKFNAVRTQEIEVIEVHEVVKAIWFENTISNVPWLINACIDHALNKNNPYITRLVMSTAEVDEHIRSLTVSDQNSFERNYMQVPSQIDIPFPDHLKQD